MYQTDVIRAFYYHQQRE